MKKVTSDKYTGCMLGGAIGDALGAPVEFMGLREIRSRYGRNGVTDYVEYQNNCGQFTDDTQMTLFTAEALLRAEHRAMLRGIGGALNTIAWHSYLRWLYTQKIIFDIESLEKDGFILLKGWLVKQKSLYKQRAPGNTCISALKSGIAGSIDMPINNSKGCGTIMRVAPVGLMYFGANECAFQVACDLSAITHGHPTGFLSAGFFASIISDLAVGVNLMDSIKNAKEILKTCNNHKETLKAVKKALKVYKLIKSGDLEISAETLEELGQGWVAEEALSISLLASLLFENDFEKGVLFAVNHSGDSDSTGSITGNILGLINGIDKIPKKWINNLEDNRIVKEIAEDLYTRVKGDSFDQDDEWWEKYPGF